MSLLLLLIGCQLGEYPTPVVGSTYRLEKDVWDRETEIVLDLLTNDHECSAAQITELDLCRPKVDRARGEVNLSFVFRDIQNDQVVARSLAKEQIIVRHARSAQTDYTLIPHRPQGAGQLFVVVVDGSGSMQETDGGTVRRIEKVEKALLSKQVTSAFFPENDSTTAVVLLTFSSELKPLDGSGTITLIESEKEYRRTVKEYLTNERSGFTHLYGAVREATGKLLKEESIKSFLSVRAAQPTIIVLTDGFNNEAGSDVCSDNVPRLERTLEAVRKARGATTPPSILYAVGLGEQYRKGEKPDGLNQTVTINGLCGKFADERIDGLLEREGIDHISLSWLAEAGGGRSYVRKSSRELAQVFAETAAKRYEWFEVRYRVPDPLWHRQSFVTRLELTVGAGYRGGSEVRFLPSPWLDGPPATDAEDGWLKLAPLRQALRVLMPILGGLVLLSFLGAASFNASRAIFRRARPRR